MKGSTRVLYAFKGDAVGAFFVACLYWFGGGVVVFGGDHSGAELTNLEEEGFYKFLFI